MSARPLLRLRRWNVRHGFVVTYALWRAALFVVSVAGGVLGAGLYGYATRPPNRVLLLPARNGVCEVHTRDLP